MPTFWDARYKNPSVNRIAEHWFIDYLPVFERVKKEWNIPIRNFYKKIMSVHLKEDDNSSNANSSSIRIHIEPIADMKMLMEIDYLFGNIDFRQIDILKKFLVAAEPSLPLFSEDSPHDEHLADIIALTKKKLDKLDPRQFNNDLFKIFFEGDTDIFGRYYLKGGIVLYVIPCVLFCEANGLDLYTFVVMILAHELAHGYNHRGKDKDNYMWKNFGRVDTMVLEGLAQYYTYEFLKKQLHKLEEGKRTFMYLLKYQAIQYRCFEEWDTTPEKIYSTFIEFRRGEYNKYEDFLQMLAGAKIRIHGDVVDD